ncbi:MAG: mechanosensitive ion channel [Flavobacteriaceae bacterium]|nr:mechanosensitive ion channel [Flavobacteriaceae bacterium]
MLSTLIGVAILVVITQLIRKIVGKFAISRSLDPNRKKIILNIFYGVIYLLLAIMIAIIWGVDMKEFTVFISSILAVLGVGFFAQWSILSNLTASVILFFYHPFRIGHRIRVIDKDYNWVGEITDITGFFVFMKTDDGQYISLPTSMVLQKGIEMLDEEEAQ